MKKVEVCLSPELAHLYPIKESLVVVADVLRATSSMVTAFAYGVEKIIPATTLEACKKLQEAGYLAAAEREGQKVGGFDLDNSPCSYQRRDLQGKTIAMTTTNGTRSIMCAQEARQVVIGAFLNLSAIATYCLQQQHDVIILCAGWKGKVNMEDTLFAGALLGKLKQKFTFEDDASLGAHLLYRFTKGRLANYIANTSRAKKLCSLNTPEDIDFCLKLDRYAVVPVLVGGVIQRLA